MLEKSSACLLTKPNILFALLTIVLICREYVKAESIITPRSLKYLTHFRLKPLMLYVKQPKVLFFIENFITLHLEKFSCKSLNLHHTLKESKSL